MTSEATTFDDTKWADVWESVARKDVIFELLVGYFFASVGFWLPMAIAAYMDRDMAKAFYQSLSTGQAYTFALPLLVSASIFVTREYRQNTASDYRRQKMYLVVAASVVIFLQALCLGADAARTPPLPESWQWQYGLQLVITIVSVALAALLYGLERLDDQAPFVANKRKEELAAKILEIQGAETPPGWDAGDSTRDN